MNPTNDKTMEAIKLQSMTDLITWVDEKRNGNGGHYDIIIRYKNFLKQPLKLGMFVPCDENGNVLDPSDVFKSCEKGFLYGKAKERVLFKGFEVKKSPYDKTNTTEYIGWEPYNASIFLNLRGSGWKIMDEYLTIEDLVKSKIELTETAIKQIGL